VHRILVSCWLESALQINTLRLASTKARQRRPTLPFSLRLCVFPRLSDDLPSLLPRRSCFRTFAFVFLLAVLARFSHRLCFTNIDRLSPRHRPKIALSSPRASHFSCSALALCCSTTLPPQELRFLVTPTRLPTFTDGPEGFLYTIEQPKNDQDCPILNAANTGDEGEM